MKHSPALPLALPGLLCLLLLIISFPALSADTLDISQADNNLILNENHGGDGSAWGKEECAICHLRKQIHKDVPLIKGIVRKKGYDTCTACHGTNGTDKPQYCTTCHNEQDLPSSPPLAGHNNHNFSVEEVSELGDSQCLSCHRQSDMDGKLEINVDLTMFPDAKQLNTPYRGISDFCVRCHNRDHQQADYPIEGANFRDPMIAVEDAFNYIDYHGLVKGSGKRTYAGLRKSGYKYQQIVQCDDCHAMHGTTNPKLIVDSSLIGVRKLPEAFRAQDHRIEVEHGDYSQLCVLRHQMEEISDDGAVLTGNNLSGVHEVGTDCRICHTHGLASQSGL